MNISNVSEIEDFFKPNYKRSDRPKISNSRDAHILLKEAWDQGKLQILEEFKAILLDNSNRVMGIVNIAQGGKAQVAVDMSILFSIALKAAASKIILAHNHPSGRLMASEPDKLLTEKAILASKVLDLEVCDHIIITNDGYFSFKDEGLL